MPASPCTRTTSELALTKDGSSSFALLWDVDHYVLVTGNSPGGGGEIATTLLDAAGVAISSRHVIETGALPVHLPSIVKTASGYALAWEAGSTTRAVHLAALDTSASLAGSVVALPAVAAVEARPTLSMSPGGLALGYMDVTGGLSSVFVTQLDTSLHPTGVAQRLGTTTAGASHPWLVGDATSLVALWADKRAGQFDPHFGDLGVGLTLTNDHALRSGVTGDALLGHMVATATGYFAAWEDPRFGGNAIWSSVTDSTGTSSSNAQVNPFDGDASWPSMAFSGTEIGVAYYQYRGTGTPQIYFALLDAGGQLVGPGGDLTISDTPLASKARFPSVTWSGSEFGVGWVDTRSGTTEIYFASVACP